MFTGTCIPASAKTELPNGSVKGMPEKIAVIDNDGNAVSESGDYFFVVKDMTPFETYSKKIQIMNLREDKAYHIYFYAEPVSKSGEIDLENECSAKFHLNGEKIFEGKVTGKSSDGTTDLSVTPIDLGLYKPGDSNVLNCEVQWNGIGEGGHIDDGARLINYEGTHILREGSGDPDIEGEVLFKWKFYAEVDEAYYPPNTGLFGQEPIYIDILGLLGISVIIIIIFCIKNKKGKRHE